MPGREYTNQPDRRGTTAIRLTEAGNWQNAPAGSLEAELAIGSGTTPMGIGWGQVVDGKATVRLAAVKAMFPPGTYEVSAAQEIRLSLLVVDSRGQGYDRVLICDGKDASNPLASIGVGEWSDWVFQEFPYDGSQCEGSMRFKLLSLDPDGGNLRLIRSEVYPSQGWTFPESLGKELIDEIGPFFEWPASNMRIAFGGVAMAGQEQIADALLRDTLFEELRYQAMWLPRAARYVQEKYGWDLYYLHWHLPDSLAHAFLARFDPASPFCGEDAEISRNGMREGYRIADEMLGAFLDMADDNTYVIVVSDHGCTPDYSGMIDVDQFLVDNGFLSREGDVIDWSRTRAFSHGQMQFEVNLKGRNPHGIVAPEDYQKVQEEIIDALHSWKDPGTGKRPIALALRKKDAQIVGYWGPTTADVVCRCNDGFAISPLQDQSIGPARDFSEHTVKLPTDRTSISSDLATFIMKGPGIRASYERDPERLGFMHLVDVVPTVCHLMGFRPPAQSQGAALWDMIE